MKRKGKRRAVAVPKCAFNGPHVHFIGGNPPAPFSVKLMSHVATHAGGFDVNCQLCLKLKDAVEAHR